MLMVFVLGFFEVEWAVPFLLTDFRNELLVSFFRRYWKMIGRVAKDDLDHQNTICSPTSRQDTETMTYMPTQPCSLPPPLF